MAESQHIKFEYNVKTSDKLNPKFIESYEYRFINSSEYIFYLTTEQKEKLSVNPAIIEISRINLDPENLNKRLFKPDTLLNWSRDNYGPIYIPIEVEGEEASKLYFLLGDNRHNANDSRFIGFVPLSNIIGTIKEKDKRR